MANAGEVSPFTSFFQSLGYAPIHPGIQMFQGSVRHMVDNGWYRRARQLPARFSIKPWSATNDSERVAIREGEGIWYPSLLSPFVEEKSIDPEYSLVLYDQDELVGWIIVDRMGASTLLFKTMFVKTPFQPMGRGLALFAEAIHRMVQKPELTDAVCFVEAVNEPMLQAMRRRIMGPDSLEQILWRTYKTIN